MDYLSLQKALFEEWKQDPLHKNNVFIEDGVIDCNKWENSSKRILFFLKEAYSGDESWSLTKTIREEWKGPKYKLWWTASYWLYVLTNTTKDKIPIFPQTMTEINECRELLLSSAVINIKKSHGKSYSNSEELEYYAKIDKERLQRQIKLISPSPDIIICGYTKDLFQDIWGKELKPITNTEYIYYDGSKIIIDFWHPSNQFPDKLCYYALGHLYQRILGS